MRHGVNRGREGSECPGMTQTPSDPPWQSQPEAGGAAGTHPAQVGPPGETEAQRGRCRQATSVGWEGGGCLHTQIRCLCSGVSPGSPADTQCRLRHPGLAHLATIWHARRAQGSRRSCVTSASPVEMSQVPQSFLNCSRHLCQGPGLHPSPANPAFGTVIILHRHSDEGGPVSCTSPQALHYNSPTRALL